MISIRYEPWTLRGVVSPVWQVYVKIEESHNTSKLREVKEKLNTDVVKGVVLVENRSRALKRLGNGWKELDNGLWYKIFP